MSAALSPPKVVLLAAQFTATGDIASLASLAASHGDALRKKLILRLLLTYLPSHLTTEEYLPLLQSLESADYSNFFPLQDVDISSVQSLSDEQATKKVRKLRLQPLSLQGTDLSIASSKTSNGEQQKDQQDADAGESEEDPLAIFLIQRAYAVDDGSGALPELPSLLAPFLSRSYHLRTWTISVLLPLLRRNCEYYPDAPLQQTLADFENLPDRLAVARLLSQTGSHEDTLPFVGRDLRGLIGPWLYNERRWTRRKDGATTAEDADAPTPADGEANGLTPSLCPGWEEVLQWLITHATKSWRIAARAIEQWDGPSDADLGGFGTMWLDDSEQGYLELRYARAALACVYLLPESSEEAMLGAHAIVSKITGLLDQDPLPALPTDLSLLPPVSTDADLLALLTPKNAVYLRNGLLDEANALTKPSPAATNLLHALVLSASLLNKMGAACTIRRAGELAMLKNEREQKAEVNKAIHWVATNGARNDVRNDDRYWITARNEILWLRDWGADDDWSDQDAASTGNGVFGQVKREFIEVEFLKALLTNTRFALARSLYEDSPDHLLSKELAQETILAAAMTAYDNASNPNRTRGGIKKCDEIIHTFPLTVERSHPATRRVEALIAATHGLCDYRLVLKQGEPFTPVVLRVHTDPLSILGKVLEQNPRSYTNIQALLTIATDIVDAGLTVRDKSGQSALTTDQAPLQRALACRRVTAMCIDAALNEDDFETAYSYVVSRLALNDELPKVSTSSYGAPIADTWSWRAALEAGKYRRTERTVRPTHLGTASANLEIRHLEQRIECLATALRIAPSETLQEILNAYRRCEEELETAVKAEDEQENAWDDVADHSWQHDAAETKRRRQQQNRLSSGMPGGFGAELGGSGSGSSSPSSSGRNNRPLASRVAAAASAAATATYGGQASTRSGPRQPGSTGAGRPPQRQQSASAATAGAASDDAPLSLFDLSRATARVASRNFSALSSLRQTRQLVGLGGGGGNDGNDRGHGGDNDSGNDTSDADGHHVRKRDQLRDAAMGTLTSGVGWLIGAQPVDRGHQER